MPLLVLLAPLLLIQGKGAPPAPIVPPKAPIVPSPVGPPATSEEIARWSGWKIGGGSPVTVPTLPGVFDRPIPDPGPEAADATVFRLKVFLLRRSESVGTKEDPRPLAAVLDPADETRARQAISNLSAIVRKVSGNRVRLETSITVDEDGLGPTDAAEYVRYRINGGRFDAEDGVDRGPFSGVMILGPFLPRQNATVNGTPGAAVDLYGAGVDVGGTQLEASLLENWLALVHARVGGEAGGSGPPPREWPDAPALFTPSLRATITPTGGIANGDAEESARVANLGGLTGADRGPYSGAVGVWIENDPERGSVLRYREASYERNGQFALPEITAPAGKNLAFWMRHATSDPIRFRMFEQVGFDNAPAAPRDVVFGEGGAGEASVPFPADGKWRRYVVRPGQWMAFGPPPSLIGRMRRDNPVVNVWLSDFEWTDDAPTPTAISPRAARLAAIASATPAERLAALASGDSGLAFAALDGLDPKTPGFDAAVIPLLSDVNAVLARRAAQALAGSSSPDALAALKRALTLGPSEAVRQEAAMVLGKRGDPATIPLIAILLGRPNWRSRLAAVEALAPFRQTNGIRFRLSATLQDNPQIRYAALLPAGLEDPDERQKLLYAAINDPADAVRLLASEKLLDSTDPAIRTEGLRAAADDSFWVRARMQAIFARRKDAAFKEAILKGATDAVPLVRAEAARALGAIGMLDPKNAPGLFTDPNLLVLIALNDEAKSGRTKLPESTLALIRASKDFRLVGP